MLLQNLNLLHGLTYFESSKMSFSAKLPPGWAPILADQNQQRKHPQHLLAETVNHTKSWRYITKNIKYLFQILRSCRQFFCFSFNEFVLFLIKSSTSPETGLDSFTAEIYLNKPVQVGCVQIKLKFNKELNCSYELRLYKQKKSPDGLSATKSVDSKVDFK